VRIINLDRRRCSLARWCVCLLEWKIFRRLLCLRNFCIVGCSLVFRPGGLTSFWFTWTFSDQHTLIFLPFNQLKITLIRYLQKSGANYIYIAKRMIFINWIDLQYPVLEFCVLDNSTLCFKYFYKLDRNYELDFQLTFLNIIQNINFPFKVLVSKMQKTERK